MSIFPLSWVLRHSEEKLGRRLVLLVLADHAREDGTAAWPAVDTIAQHARLSRRAVQDALRALEESGAIRRRGVSQSGTTVYDVVMGGADFAPRAEGDVQGVQNGAPGGAKSAPDPSLLQPSGEPGSNRGSAKRILAPHEEPVGFSEWLGFLVEECARYEIKRSVPRTGTMYRSELARSFARLLEEGYELEQLKAATVGVLADDFMRRGGHTAPENVMRPTKIGKRIDEGRAVLEKREGGLGRFDGGDPRA